MSHVIEAKGLSRYYTQKNPKLFARGKLIVKACDEVSFTLNPGEVLGIIGESGCGKSTLGRVLVGLEPATAGELLVNGETAAAQLKADNKRFRRAVQIVFQNPFDTFPPKHTIARIMLRALKIHNIGADENERYSMCRTLFEQSGLRPAEDYLSRYPHELSGGQLQRISILRSMMLKPSFMVADEPVSMLDVSVRAEIINMLTELVRQNNTALAFISHDITVTRYISDRIVVMYLGRIVESGTSEEIVHNPKHPYTQILISNCASIDFEEAEDPIEVQGEPPSPIDPGPGCYFADRCHLAEARCHKTYPDYATVSEGHIAACHLLHGE